MVQEAKASRRKATGIHNRLDRAIPTRKRGWRGPGELPKDRCV